MGDMENSQMERVMQLQALFTLIRNELLANVWYVQNKRVVI